jgi:hypothetical protein
MNNYRKEIKNRLVQILQNASAEIGIPTTKIFSNRALEVITPNQVPCVIVNVKSENARRIISDVPVREYELELPVKIDCIIEKSGNFLDELDDLMDKVLKVLLRNEMDQFNTVPKWGDLTYSGLTQDFSEDGNKVLGMGYIDINIIYQAKADVTIPDDYEQSIIDYTFNVTGQFQDNLNLPNGN